MFQKQIGNTIEVYTDDMVFKSLLLTDHIAHLEDTFTVLREYGMKVNPIKCSFGMTSGKFLGYIVTQWGIEANPGQVQAFQKLQSPRNIKEVK